MIPFDDIIISTFAAIHSSSPELSSNFWTAAQSEGSSPASDLLFAVRSRFPLSFLPHLNLLVASSPPINKRNNISLLPIPANLHTNSCNVDLRDTISSKKNVTTHLITLKNDLRVFSERDDGEGAVIVQTGTIGRLLSRGESVPTVMWEWPFNGWALLGRVLRNDFNEWCSNVISSDESYVAILRSNVSSCWKV